MSRHRDVQRADTLMDAYMQDLASIVNIDSGTYLRAGVNQVGAYLQQRFQDFGFSTSFDQQQEYGDHLLAVHQGQNPRGPRVLLIGHIDTVFPADEAKRRPFSLGERNGYRIAKGPGVLDMKSGVLIGMYALHALITAHEDTYQSATFLCNSDEEIGSPTSRSLVKKLAQQADAVLVLEPGRAKETVVSSRRGCGQFRIEAFGRAAHAGVEPHLGRNAILELSYQVQKMQALNGTIPGTTLNVGIIRGGERTNIVPDYAYFDMDVRVSDSAAAQALEAAIYKTATQHMLEGTRLQVSGSILCQAFESNKVNAPLVRLVKEVGRDLNITIRDVGSGGASDANNAAAIGIPTLDGLGAGGGLAHNPDEYIELDYLPERIALVAGLIRRLPPTGR